MANWTKNAPNGGSTRRKWKLEDRNSLNNLKYHIAEEGCAEIQFDLAKQLLENSLEENEPNTKQQAVHWLVSAAQQGHEAAAQLLRQCYADGCGITADNESQVRCCLSMTAGERAARKAARELFACLSKGSEHITPRQLERKMRQIYHMQKRHRHQGDSDSTSTSEDDEEHCDKSIMGNGDVPHISRKPRRRNGYLQPDFELHERRQRAGLISEENLLTAAVNYAAGRMPLENGELVLSVPHPASLDHVPCFHRLLFHPIIFFTLLYHRLINFIAALPATVPSSVRLAALFSFYLLASHDNLTIFLPICFYYICLGIMIWSTCKMLKTKQEFVDFRIWSGLFLSYGDHNIEADSSENRFLKNNMKPYLYFFIAFVGNLLVYPLIAAEWLPHSELTIISGIFVFVSLIVFMYCSSLRQRFPDWFVLVSFGVNVLAKYPYEMDEVALEWRFLDLKVPTFCSFVIGNGIEFCLNCRTALYLLIPGFLIHLAKRSRWNGTYTYLIPHCVTLSWLQLCINSAQSATMFGVVRATLVLAGVVLFLPLFGIVSLLVPVFVAIDWLGFADPTLRMGSTLVAIIIAMLTSCFLAINRRTQKYITAIQILLCVIAACVLTFPYMTSNFKDTPRFKTLFPGDDAISQITGTQHSHPKEDSIHALYSDYISREPLSWAKFYALCGEPAWEQQNKIKSQLRCSHLDGMPVAWEATVTQIQIARVTNIRAEYIAKYLPHWLGQAVMCMYGETIAEQLKCDAHSEPLCDEMQRLLKSNHLQGRCSLHKWNSYDYEIHVLMSTSRLLSKGSNVVLQASDVFGNFTQQLVAGDRINFYGTLFNSRFLPNNDREDYILGASHANVQLRAMECVQCHSKQLSSVHAKRPPAKSSVDERMRDLTRGIKYLLNVLLNPLITFK